MTPPLPGIVGQPRQAFWAKCECDHTWIVAYTPMILTQIARMLAGLHCPNCGADAQHIRPAKQANGLLLVEAAAASTPHTQERK